MACRRWCFTDNKCLNWRVLYKEHEELLKFMGFAEEKAPSTGQQHVQGFLGLSQLKRLGGLKKLFGKEVHWEPMKGSIQQNVEYCSKENPIILLGTLPEPGRRLDLEAIIKAVNERKDPIEIIKEYPGAFRLQRAMETYRTRIDHRDRKGLRKLKVVLITGPTGCGKTYPIATKEGVFMICGGQMDWWDLYNGERILLLDEYSNDVKITTLLGLLDIYRYRLPVKGSFTYANWTEVYITTNLRYLHQQAPEEHQKALSRRINEIWNYWEGDGVAYNLTTHYHGTTVVTKIPYN